MKGIIIIFVLLVIAVFIWQCNKKSKTYENIIDIDLPIQKESQIIDFNEKNAQNIYKELESIFKA